MRSFEGNAVAAIIRHPGAVIADSQLEQLSSAQEKQPLSGGHQEKKFIQRQVLVKKIIGLKHGDPFNRNKIKNISNTMNSINYIKQIKSCEYEFINNRYK